MEVTTIKETCEKCGKVFWGNNAKAQLHGHMKSHTVQERIEKDRVPFGTPQRLFSCPENDGFHYRVFNDQWAKEPGRIQRAKKAGYEIVKDTGSYPVGTNDDGSPIKGILMRIPQEMYDSDQAVKQLEVDKVDEQIKSGTLEQNQNDNRYSPAGIRITESHTEPQ